MLRTIRWILPVLALGLLVPYLAKAADDKKPAENGSVTGIVKDAEGNVVAGAKVALLPHVEGDDHADHKHKPTATQLGTDKAGASDDKHDHDKPKAKPVAKGETDGDGKFTLSNVPPGEYDIVAKLKGKGVAREHVDVEAGKAASVELTLKMRADKGKGDKQQ